MPIQLPEEWIAKVKAREPGIDDARAKLVALIEHMDEGIGRVMATLEGEGYAENTVVVFTSDNGAPLSVGGYNGNLRDGKASMYEGGLKVATAVSWPGMVQAGTRSDYVAISMDLFATLVDIAGVPVTHFFEGKSFLPTFRGEMQDWRQRDLFFSRREGGTRFGGKTIEAVRRGDWKLLQNSPFERQELYNLAEDPLENNNLIDDQPEIFSSLAAVLRAHIQEGGKVR
jgi:arylsulfatase A-like enzyme